MVHLLQSQIQGQISSSETQVLLLREELDTANKKVDRYVHLVASISEELDNLRRSICHNCKKEFVLLYAPASSLDGAVPRPLPWRRVVSGIQSPSSGLPPTITGLSPNVFIPIRSTTIRQNQTNPTILAQPQASSSATILTQPLNTPDDEKIHRRCIVNGRPTRMTSRFPPVLTTNTVGPQNVSIPNRFVTVQQNPAILAPTQAASSTATPIPTQPTTLINDEIQSKQSLWGVSHNPNIKPSLQIDLVKTFNFTAKVTCVKFSPNGKYLAVGTSVGSGKTFVYDMEKGLEICCFVDLYLKNQPRVKCIEFSPDNKYIATSSDEIRLWEIARKRNRFTLKSLYSIESLCFSPNGHFLVAGEGSRVRIWSLRDGSSKTLLDGAKATFSITFSPDGRHIASVDFSGLLRIWNARTGQLLDTCNSDTQDGVCVAFSPDGKWLVSGGNVGILRYWDVSSLGDMEIGRDRVISENLGRQFQQIRTFGGHSSWIYCISFSPDCQWVATSSHDNTVRIWDPHTAEWQCTLHGDDPHGGKVDFSPAGKYLASGGGGRYVRVWKYGEI